MLPSTFTGTYLVSCLLSVCLCFTASSSEDHEQEPLGHNAHGPSFQVLGPHHMAQVMAGMPPLIMHHPSLPTLGSLLFGSHEEHPDPSEHDHHENQLPVLNPAPHHKPFDLASLLLGPHDPDHQEPVPIEAHHPFLTNPSPSPIIITTHKPYDIHSLLHGGGEYPFTKVTLKKLLSVAGGGGSDQEKAEEFFVDSRTSEITVLLRSNDGLLPEMKLTPPITGNDKPLEMSRTGDSVSQKVVSPTPGLWTVTVNSHHNRKSRWSLSVEAQSQLDFQVSFIKAAAALSDAENCETASPVAKPLAANEELMIHVNISGLPNACEPTEVELKATDGGELHTLKLGQHKKDSNKYCTERSRLPARPFYVVVQGQCLGKRMKNIEFTQRTMPELVQPVEPASSTTTKQPESEPVKPVSQQPPEPENPVSVVDAHVSHSSATASPTVHPSAVEHAESTAVPTKQEHAETTHSSITAKPEEVHDNELKHVTTPEPVASTVAKAKSTVEPTVAGEQRQPASELENNQSIKPEYRISLQSAENSTNDVCKVIKSSINSSCSLLSWYNTCSKYYWDAKVELGVGQGSTINFESAGGQVSWHLSESKANNGRPSPGGLQTVATTVATARGSCCVARVYVHVLHEGVKTTCVVRNSQQSATSVVNNRLIIITLSILLAVCMLAVLVMLAVHFWRSRQNKVQQQDGRAHQLSQLAFDNSLYGKKISVSDGEGLKESSET